MGASHARPGGVSELKRAKVELRTFLNNLNVPGSKNHPHLSLTFYQAFEWEPLPPAKIAPLLLFSVVGITAGSFLLGLEGDTNRGWGVVTGASKDFLNLDTSLPAFSGFWLFGTELRVKTFHVDLDTMVSLNTLAETAFTAWMSYRTMPKFNFLGVAAGGVINSVAEGL